MHAGRAAEPDPAGVRGRARLSRSRSPAIRKILFVCSQNRLRSPTAEHVFAKQHGLEVASAGLNHDAETPLTGALVAWADVIAVMEKTHLRKLRQRFGGELRGQRVVCLDIPGVYTYLQPELVALLESRMARVLR